MLGNGSGVYTSVFGTTRLKHTFCVSTLLPALQGNSPELLATTLTTLSSDPSAHHPTSNTLYALCKPQPDRAPPQFTTSLTHQTPQVNSGMIAAILIRKRDPHSKHVPLAGAVPEPAREEGKKKK